MTTAAFIPVRGGSKSIPLKNIKHIGGRPLVYWSIDAAVQCSKIDEVIVSTDSNAIRNVVNNYDRNDFGKLRCIDRSPENAMDTSTTESVLLEFAEGACLETIVLIQATSPLIEAKHLNEALELYTNSNCDSLLSVVRQKRFIWETTGKSTVIPKNYSLENRPRRQDFNGYLVENGSFYITNKVSLIESKMRVSGKISCYEMPDETYIEIDEPSDWLMVEQLLNDRKRETNISKKIEKIKIFATDCDGVLTDAGMYYSQEGDSLKKFNTKDGLGLRLLKEHGFILAILTGENSQIVQRRAEKLGIEHIYLGCTNKVAAMQELLEKYSLTFEEVGYIGDDINDIDLLNKVGFSCTVQDAVDVVKNRVDYVASKNGGDGAVREIADLILSLRCEMDELRKIHN